MRFLFPFFCRYVVPRLKFLRLTGFRLVQGPDFTWLGQSTKRPATEAYYENSDGRRARLRVELLP